MASMNGRLSSLSQVERKGHVFVNPALRQTCLQLRWGIYQVLYFPFSRPMMRILVFYIFPSSSFRYTVKMARGYFKMDFQRTI